MITFKQYLVVTEYKGAGYMVGFYDNLKEAENIIEELHSYNDFCYGIKHKQLYEQAMNYIEYKVHNSCRYPLEHCPRGITDGSYFTHVFDTYLVPNFTLKQFMFERGNTILAFSLEDYPVREESFINFDIQFLSN